jgi:hypothetical protein
MSISIVHVQIKLTQGDRADLRIFGTVAAAFQSRSVILSDVADLLKRAETGYYTPLQEDFLRLGRRLFEWVDGDDRLLSRAISSHQPDVIAISAVEGLAHLPWEMLADEAGFLVSRGIVPVRWVSAGRDCIESVIAPKTSELALMLMATDPTGSTSLEYEKEEGKILAATARAGLELVVEESGCLNELELLVRDYGVGYFDAFHLTGHATSDGAEPTFGMESLTGELVNVTAREIANSFGGLPTLVFLSGCQTGKLGKAGAVASMAAQLVQAGAQAVLGWGETVDDREASLAAEILYGELAAGVRLDRALAKTYEQLMTKPRDYAVRDWHKLRLYAVAIAGKKEETCAADGDGVFGWGGVGEGCGAIDVCGTTTDFAADASGDAGGGVCGGDAAWVGGVWEEQCGGAGVRSVGDVVGAEV